MSLFITGTDTGVGKTRVATLLVRALRAQGRTVAGFKPVCCGDRGDAEALAAAGGLDVNAVNPVWLRAPLAPYAASLVEQRHVDLALIRESFQRLREQHEIVIVEGAGGWLVPITRDFSMADLAADFGLPVLIVAANRLGVINHTLLTVRAVQSAGRPCLGVLLNCTQPAADDASVLTNRAILEDLLDVPVLGELTHDGAADELPLNALFPA